METRKVVVLVAACLAAASGAVGTGTVRASSPEPTATLPPADTAADAEWQEVVPGGDCACADGSEFNFWVRDADPSKVVLFLEGGGACFDPTSCAPTDDNPSYDWNISADDHPSQQDGIFDLANAENPFAGHSFVYVPYCTGDVHLGHLTREYSPELTISHVGAVNGMTALAHLRDSYGGAEQVVVVGESAGAIAAPVYGGLVSDLLPDAQVTVYADGAGAYPDDPNLNAGMGALWGASGTMPDWEVNQGLEPQDWGVPRFWIQAGLHDPDIVLGRFDHASDAVQAQFIEVVGADASDLPALVAANDEQVAAAGITRHHYTAPGDDHTLVREADFYTMEVDGVRLVDWVRDLVTGTPVEDVP